MDDDARPRKRKRAKCQKCAADVQATGPDAKGVYRAECPECRHVTLFKAKDDERPRDEEPRVVDDTRNDETSPLAKRPAAAPPKAGPHFKGTKTRSDDEQPGYDPADSDARIARGQTIPDDREPARGLAEKPARPTGVAGVLSDVTELTRLSIDLVRRAWLPALVSTLLFGSLAALLVGVVFVSLGSFVSAGGGAGFCLFLPFVVVLGLPALALLNVGCLASFGLAVRGGRPTIHDALGLGIRRVGHLVFVYFVLGMAMIGLAFGLSLCLGILLSGIRGAGGAVLVGGVAGIALAIVFVFLEAILLVLPQATCFAEDPKGITPPYGRATTLARGRFPLLFLVALTPTLIGLLVHPSAIGKAATQEVFGTNLPVLEIVLSVIGWVLSFVVQDLLSIATYGVCAGIEPVEDEPEGRRSR